LDLDLAGHRINIIPFVGIIGHHPIFEVHLIYTMSKDCLCCCLEVTACHYAEQMSNFFILILVETAKVGTSQILG